MVRSSHCCHSFPDVKVYPASRSRFNLRLWESVASFTMTFSRDQYQVLVSEIKCTVSLSSLLSDQPSGLQAFHVSKHRALLALFLPEAPPDGRSVPSSSPALKAESQRNSRKKYICGTQKPPRTRCQGRRTAGSQETGGKCARQGGGGAEKTEMLLPEDRSPSV